MTLIFAFHDANAMVSFSLRVCKQDHWPSTHLGVHGPSHKFIIPRASLPGNSSPEFDSFSGFEFLKAHARFFLFRLLGCFFCVSFFLLIVVPQTFASVCRSSAVSFQVHADFAQKWSSLLFIAHGCSTIAAVSTFSAPQVFMSVSRFHLCHSVF